MGKKQLLSVLSKAARIESSIVPLTGPLILPFAVKKGGRLLEEGRSFQNFAETRGAYPRGGANLEIKGKCAKSMSVSFYNEKFNLFLFCFRFVQNCLRFPAIKARR